MSALWKISQWCVYNEDVQPGNITQQVVLAKYAQSPRFDPQHPPYQVAMVEHGYTLRTGEVEAGGSGVQS